jgi:1-acyl-sn-glycerol-3-phosphate acyltransferase
MRTLRIAARVAVLLAVAAALFPLAAATRVVRPVGPRAMRWAARVQSWWAGASLWICGVRVDARGLAALPRGLMCANHRGYLDVLVLAAHVPGRFVAMREIRGWPLLGWMARSSGTIFLQRERGRDLPLANAEVDRTLAAGIPILLFPEGRSGPGHRLRPLRSPLFEPAARRGAPCAAMAIEYATPDVPWSTAWTVAWWGGMDLPRHAARLLALPRIEARLTLAGEPLLGADRKALADAVGVRLAATLRPVAFEPAPPDNPWDGLRPEA